MKKAKFKKMLLGSGFALLTLLSPLSISLTFSCSNSSNVDNEGDSGSDGGTGAPDNSGGGTTGPSGGSGNPGESGGDANPGGGGSTETPPPDIDQEKPIAINTSVKRMPNPTSFHTTASKILKRDVERKINNNLYDTQILRDYPTFKYPGWEYNYEGSTNGQPNRYQVIDGERIDGMDLVYNERVEFNNTLVKFNNPDFILNEIENDQLKVHPATKLWFQQEVDPEVKAIEKAFAVSSALPGNTPLGLYAAPGEVVTMTFELETLQKMKQQKIDDFRILINDSFWDNFVPGNTGQMSTRYPFVRTEFRINVDKLIQNNGVFKFGSPFGGAITVRVNKRLRSANSSSMHPAYDHFKFKVSGALETIYYNHTQTTKEDWDDQIERAKAGKIVAPAMQYDFAFGAITFASTGKQQFVGANLDDIANPFDVMERWTEFLFVSSFFSGKDLDNSFKLWFQFNDDIQNGAGGVGGNRNLQGPLSWAKQSFLDGLVKDGIDTWLIDRQWGTFHEINHNFNQDRVLFYQNDHQETNQVSMVGLSLLSDQGRWRNLYNADGNWNRHHGSWNRFANAWTVNQRLAIDNFQRENKKIPYELQYLLLNTFGSYNFLDYVRDDLISDPNNRPGWTGFSEIVRLSKWFKLDLWPAMREVGNWFNETNSKRFNPWPTDDNDLKPEEKLITDELQKDFKAIDFMANLFAAGGYLWNQSQNKFVYTNDTQAPLDIAAGRDYIFDFEKGINSANPNVEWNDLEFSKTTKLGGSLKVDENNSKILIYTPPKNAVGEIDEFDMAISNFSFKNNKMPPNYVDKYVWKIKVRLVGNAPAISIYKDRFVPDSVNKPGKFREDFEYLKNPDNIKATLASDPRPGILAEPDEPNALSSLDKKWTRAKISFDFIAPETGNYDFKIKGFGWAFLVDRANPDQIIWENNNNNKPNANAWSPMFAKQLNKGERFKLDLYVTTKLRTTRFDIKANINNKFISVFDHSVLPWVDEIIDEPNKLITEEKYQYKFRRLDMDRFQSPIGGIEHAPAINAISKGNQNSANGYKFKIINEPNYVSPPGLPAQDKDADKRLTSRDKMLFEKWGGSAAANQPLVFQIEATFKELTKVGSIQFVNHQGTPYGGPGRPTDITVYNQDQQILYQGKYGAQQNDRMKDTTIINFDGSYDVTKLIIELKNTDLFREPEPNEPERGKFSGIILNSITFSEKAVLAVNRKIATNEEKINYYGPSWHNVTNDFDVNISQVNGQAVRSIKKDEYLEFNLLADGFDIIGQKLPTGSKFALYINDDLIGEYDTKNEIRLDGDRLATYHNPKPGQWMKIKIVNLEDASLTLDYFQTYGPLIQTK